MTFLDFSKIFGNIQIIDIRNVATYFNGIDRRRLYEWQQRGLILKITSNYYLIAGRSLDDQALRNIACHIYAPSYIGLASALSWYNFIPEAVFQTTSITTRRNKLIRTSIGDFHYRSIKPEYFFGTNVVYQNNDHFFISDPEKTLLDYLYFTPDSDNKRTLDEMRWNFDAIRQVVDWQRLKDYLTLFASPKLDRAVRYLRELMHVES